MINKIYSDQFYLKRQKYFENILIQFVLLNFEGILFIIWFNFDWAYGCINDKYDEKLLLLRASIIYWI